jgi:hypothetical protein
MKSKLFHTLVCFGISLGTAAGCGGASSSEADGPGAPTDAGVDPGDASTDAPPDAFCDATWPTTKGAPAPPLECVDPMGECADKGWPTRCAMPVAPFECAADEVATFCIDREWQCGTNGSVPLTECRCFSPPPAGYVCTEDGLVPDTG